MWGAEAFEIDAVLVNCQRGAHSFPVFRVLLTLYTNSWEVMLSFLNASYHDGSSSKAVKEVEIFQSNPAYVSYTEFCEKEVIGKD